MKKVHPIKALIAQGEHQRLDFKFEISDAAKIARSLVAFANTDGGKLLIGIKDNGVVAGIRSEEEKFMVENAAQRYCQPEVVFQSKEWIVDQKHVLEVSIPKSKNTPHRAPDLHGKYKAFVRVKDQNLLANGVLMKVWEKNNSGENIQFEFNDATRRFLSYLESNQTIDLEETQNQTGFSKYNAEQLLSDLICLDVIDMEITEENTVFVSKIQTDN